MTEFRPRVFWPLSAWLYVLPGVAVGLVAFAATLPTLAWPYQDWVITSAEFHQQNAYAAPIAAGLAAVVAGRLTPPTRIYAQPISARAGWGVVGPHLARLVGTVLVGYLLGLTPLTLVTTTDAEHGGFDLAVALTRLLGLTAATVVGYLVGVLGRTSLVAPVAVVLLFAASIAGSTSDTFSALAPVLHFVPGVGSDARWSFVLYRLAFLTVLVVAAAWAAAELLRAHRAGAAPAARALLPLLAPVALAVPPLLITPALYALDDAPPKVCEVRAGVEYRVHEGHRSELAGMVTAVGGVFETFGSSGPARRVYDQALAGVGGDDVLWYSIKPDNPVDSGRVDVAAAPAGATSCPSTAAEGREVANDLYTWLMAAGEPAEGFAFHGVPAERVRAWIAEHRDEIRTCAPTGAEVPR
ncbi:hypothetical protein ABZ816_20885 [Actinosynnema sp. NPDC047251]|uniref:hypothetical protein n=1 Tax=Saccharothrix espanaensis TaxID=103731 RepID=UPI0018D3FA58|nr:hypothetical protein [Saccharothrix espanaensis]